MADQSGGNARRADLPRSTRHAVELDLGGKLADLDRREWRREVPSQAIAKPDPGTRGSPHVDPGVRIEKRGEEQQPLDVVHVKVAEQQMHALAGGRAILTE